MAYWSILAKEFNVTLLRINVRSKKVKLTTSTDLGLIRTCAGVHAIHQRNWKEQRQRGVLLPEAVGQGARRCIICSWERVTWSVLTAVMAALTGMSPRSQPKQIPGAREAGHRNLLLYFWECLLTFKWTVDAQKVKENGHHNQFFVQTPSQGENRIADASLFTKFEK